MIDDAIGQASLAALFAREERLRYLAGFSSSTLHSRAWGGGGGGYCPPRPSSGMAL